MGYAKEPELPMTQEQAQRVHDLFLQYYNELAAYARSYIGRGDLAEEAVQKMFLDICRKPHKLPPPAECRPWLRKACQLSCLALLRCERQRRSKEVLIDTIPEQPFFDRYSFTEDLCSLLGITQEELNLLHQCFVEGKSYQEVAGCGGSAVAMRKRLWRLRRRLKER